MKVTILQEACGEPEVIIRCSDTNNREVCELLQTLERLDKKIPANSSSALSLLDPTDVLYGEFVGRGVFLYTHDAVLPTTVTLAQLEQEYNGFFRCSKSMVVNLGKIQALKSALGGRILATLKNGERILISRHYAGALRKKMIER